MDAETLDIALDVVTTDHGHHLVVLLTDLLLFFGVAGVIVPLLQRVKLSPVLGYLLCGIMIGPAGLGTFVDNFSWLSPLVIEDTATVQILGELGIIALLFMIGLELSFRRLKELKKYVLGLGSLQIICSAAVICGVALYFGNSTESALVLGASLALSSTAIVVQLLREKHLFNQPVGVLCFSILLMQDLAVVPILIMATVLAGSEDASVSFLVVQSLLLAVASVSIIYVVGKRFLRPLMRAVSFTKNPEWLTAFMLFVVIAAATLTQSAGLSAALGAFLAGLLIAETEFRHEIEIIIDPLKNLLLGLFFLSTGMMIDITAVLDNPYWILTSVAGIFAIKGFIIYPLSRVFGVAKPRAIKAAVMLAQPGEFTFLILSVAMISGLVSAEDGQFFLLVTTVGMMVSPFLFNAAPWLVRIFAREDEVVSSDVIGDVDESGHIIIAGFGRIGFLVGEVLESQQFSYRAIDTDYSRVYRYQNEGYPVVYGDARRSEQWRHLHIEKARAVVVTIDDHSAAQEILHTIRKHWPHVPVSMRAEFITDMERLYDLGAEHVVPETLESSLQLARTTMEMLGMEEQHIDEAIESNRKNALLTHTA